jgi:hypothetical protein
MPFTTDRARFESALGRAHRALWQAADAANAFGSLGDWEDCLDLAREVLRIAEGSLKGKVRGSRAFVNDSAYLYSSVADDRPAPTRQSVPEGQARLLAG